MKNRLGIRLFLAGILAAVLAGCSGAEGKTNPSDSTIEEENGEQVEMPKQHSAVDYTVVDGIPAEKGTYVAMVLKDLDNPYWKAVKEGAEQAVEDINSSLGYTGEDQVRLTVDGVRAAEALEGENVDSQIDTIDAVLSENPNALCLAVIDRESCTAQLEAADESDIPVILLDSGLKDQTAAQAEAVCMTDNKKAAAEAAQRLCREMGERGQIAVFAHEESSGTSRERVDGFRMEVREKYPQAEIVNVSYETEEGIPVKETLEQYPDLKGIFCTSGTVTREVLEQLEKAGREDLLVAGFDADAELIEAMREGRLWGTICQNPRGMGYAAVTAALRASAGMPVDPSIDTGYVWLDQKNYREEKNQIYRYDC